MEFGKRKDAAAAPAGRFRGNKAAANENISGKISCGAVDKLDDDLERAMGDLQQLRKYYQDSPRQVVRSSKNGNSSTPKSTYPSRNQDEASKNKLCVAEAVIRKLYERNLDLEKTLKELKSREGLQLEQGDEDKKKNSIDTKVNQKPRQHQAELEEQPNHQRPQAVDQRNQQPDPGPAPSVKNAGIVPLLSSKAEEHLKAMLESRNQTIEQQQSIIETLKTKLTERNNINIRRSSRFIAPAPETASASLELKMARRTVRESEAGLKDANARAAHYYQQVESMRAVQMLRLESKVDGRKLGPLLTEQLDAQAVEHLREMEHFNHKLAGLESENSELFVQIKLFETRLAQVSKELEQRDGIEAQIQQKVLAIFTHMKKLEAENITLRQSLGRSSDK